MIATIKQNDTKPIFKDSSPSIDGVPLTPADVVGCTLKFLMKNADGSVAVSQVATINPDATFSYQPILADVSTPGQYRQEWQMTYSNGKTITFPNNDYNTVNILPDLG